MGVGGSNFNLEILRRERGGLWVEGERVKNHAFCFFGGKVDYFWNNPFKKKILASAGPYSSHQKQLLQ